MYWGGLKTTHTAVWGVAVNLETVEKGKLIQLYPVGPSLFQPLLIGKKWFLVQVDCFATSYTALAIPGAPPPLFFS